MTVSVLAQQVPLEIDLESTKAMNELTFQVWAEKPEYTTAVEKCPGLNSQCAVIRNQGTSVFMTYSLDAAELRGKRVRFAASLLVDYPAISRAQLFMRVDTTAGVGFHAYSPSRRDDKKEWTTREIVGTVDEDAKRVTVGLRFSGRGAAFFSAPKLEAVAN